MRKLNVALAALIVALAAVVVFMLLASVAAAKKPSHAAGVTAALTATYDSSTQHLSIAGCGYDVLSPGGVQVVYTHPDATSETWYVGVFSSGCLDNNYIPANASGTWTIDTFQSGLQVAEATVTLP